MADRFPTAPAQVTVATMLLIVTSGLGVLLTSYAAWATWTVPSGVGPLLDTLSRDDRWVFRNSWVLHPDWPVPLTANLPWLIWLGLSCLLLLPLAYFVRRGFAPARTVTYVLGGALIAATTFATITDEDFVTANQPNNPGLGQLSANAHQAWLALFPPGYAGVHYTALVLMIAALFVACLLLDRPGARTFFAHRAPRRRTIRAANPRLRADPNSG